VPSLRDYRRRFARHVGTGLLAGTADASSTRTYLADPARKSSLTIGDDLVEWYLYRPAATDPLDQVRLVSSVQMDQGWFFADFPPGSQWTAPPGGEVYELLSPEFHPTEQLRDFINEALRFIRVPAEVEVPCVPLLGRQPVTDFYPWLTDGASIYQVGSLAGTAQRDNASPYLYGLRGRTEESAGSLYLAIESGLSAGGVAVGTLTAPLLAGTVATSNLTPNAQMPTTPPFYLTVDTELLQVTAIVGGTYGLARGLSSTTPADHPSGTALVAPPRLLLYGLFPAYHLCRPSGGSYGAQSGLTLDTDEAIPDPQWVTAGALKEAWVTAPQTMEALAERGRIENLQQATVAFQRWQEQSLRRRGHRTFTPYVDVRRGHVSDRYATA
jgi:hypothetical protein